MKAINLNQSEIKLNLPGYAFDRLKRQLSNRGYNKNNKICNKSQLPYISTKARHKSMNYSDRLDIEQTNPDSLSLTKIQSSNNVKKCDSPQTLRCSRSKPNHSNLFNNELIKSKLWNKTEAKKHSKVVKLAKTEISPQKIFSDRLLKQSQKMKSSLYTQRKQTVYFNHPIWHTKKTQNALKNKILIIIDRRKLQHKLSCASTQPQNEKQTKTLQY